MKKNFISKSCKLLVVPMLLSGLFIVSLSGCGPSRKEIAQRQEAARQWAAAQAAEEKARQERIAARQAELLRIEQEADAAAKAGDIAAALSGYKELLQNAKGDLDEDQRLREKIIKLVRSSKTPPPITEEVRRHIVRAQTVIKMNQDPNAAVDELSSAMLLAPWWADGYYNLGIMLEGAGHYGGAIRSLKLCLLADPNASNAEAVQNKIYELEILKENADKVQGMSGKWRNPKSGSVYTVTIEGNNFKAMQSGYVLQGIKNGYTIEGTITVPAMRGWNNNECMMPSYTVPMTGEITPDYSKITFRYMENTYTSTHWNITTTGLFAVNNTGHRQGECISVTLQGTNPEEFSIER